MLAETFLTRAPLLFDTLVTLLIYLVSAGLGRRLLRRVRLPESTPLERRLFALTLGVGAVSYLPFALFAVSVGKPPVVMGALLLVALLLIPDIIYCVRAGIETLRSGIRALTHAENKPFVVLAVAFGLSLAITYLQACRYPTDPDGLHYHLTAPLRYLHEGRFHYMPTFLHINWPLSVELLFAIGLAFNKYYAAGLVQFGLGLILLAMVYALGKRIAAPAVGWLAACVVYVWIRGEMTWAYIDIGLTLYMLAAVYAFFLGRETQGTEAETPGKINPWFLLSGVCAGLTATAKLPGLLTIGTIAVMIYFATWARSSETGVKRWLVALRPGLICGGIGVLVVLPWLIRCYAQTGTPIYPYLGKWLSVADWSPEWQQRLNESLQVFNTFRSRRLSAEQVYRLRAVACGVVFVLGVVGVNVKFTRPVRPLVVFLAAFLCLQFATSGIYIRYLLPAAPYVALLTFWLFRTRLTQQVAARWGAILLVALYIWGLHKLPSHLRMRIQEARESASVALGSVSRDAYLSEKALSYPTLRWCNQNLPPDAGVVLTLGDHYNSLLERRSYVTHYYNQNAIRFTDLATTLGDLKRHRVTHLILQVNPPTPEMIANQDTESRARETIEFARMREIAAQYGAPIYQENGYAVYELRLPEVRTN